jgi:hypothetical protein
MTSSFTQVWENDLFSPTQLVYQPLPASSVLLEPLSLQVKLTGGEISPTLTRGQNVAHL